MEVELIKESYVTVTCDPERLIGKVVWSGSPTPEQYKKAFLALLDHAKKGNKMTRFLIRHSQPGNRESGEQKMA